MTQRDLAGHLQAQLLALVFKPIHLHAQLADLLVELADQLLVILALAGWGDSNNSDR